MRYCVVAYQILCEYFFTFYVRQRVFLHPKHPASCSLEQNINSLRFSN